MKTISLLAAAIVVLCAYGLFVSPILHKVACYFRRQEWFRLQGILRNEIKSGGNVTRIMRIKQRMRELKDLGIGY